MNILILITLYLVTGLTMGKKRPKEEPITFAKNATVREFFRNVIKRSCNGTVIDDGFVRFKHYRCKLDVKKNAKFINYNPKKFDFAICEKKCVNPATKRTLGRGYQVYEVKDKKTFHILQKEEVELPIACICQKKKRKSRKTKEEK